MFSKCESTSRVCIRMEVEGYFTAQCAWIWWRSREHKFSADLPLPDCHEGARGIWTKRLFQDEDYGRKYLVRHAIDINHVEEVFQLGSLSSCPHTPPTRNSGLRCRANEPQNPSRQKICDARAKIMEIFRFLHPIHDMDHIAPGETHYPEDGCSPGKEHDGPMLSNMNVNAEVDLTHNETKVQSHPPSMFALFSSSTHRNTSELCHRTYLRQPVCCACC